MKRICLTLDLKNDPQLIAAYESYHCKEQIWPEIVLGIKACGIREMEIYRVSTRLVMILGTEDTFDLKTGFAKMLQMPRQKEWAELMEHFQQRLSFANPGELWIEMNRIFQLN